MNWLWPRRGTLEDIELTAAMRLGRLLHWSAASLVIVMWFGEFIGVVFSLWHSSNLVIGLVILLGIAIFLLGRGLRYVFANE